ncbi:DNA polymerase III subunit delta [Gracilibacillus dipsosauri]|uniref:DNA polymerase III subunit delta n=1 Tax=Gracilibacillus dipsosauri TaxID=178340 RepID=A0A317KZM8_9BACI|nr:DNA polymerase III subunit delta [Gracilibacillus dipsosauri]PWU68464.1 DNA polymerase III subunit delta [Gracilibacillus dipsosauri]
MSYLNVMEQIKKGQFSPVYYMHGTETYMMEAVKQSLLKHSIEEEDRDTNVSLYDLEEISIQDVINDTNTFPFLGEKKLVIATNASFLKAKPPNLDFTHQIETLINYIQNPAPYSILVLIAPYEKVDERKKVVKQLKKEATVISCEPLKEWNMKEAIEKIAQEHQVIVKEEVVEYILEEIGTNLMIISSEMEKLALYVGPGNTIRLEEAELLLSHQENSTGLKLVDAIIESDLAKAIHIAKDLEKMNEDPIALVALVSSQFRTLLHVKSLKQKGYSQQQIVGQLKIHPYVAKLSLNRQQKFTKEELHQALTILAETDAQIKTGKVDKSLGLELLLYQIIQLRQTTRV